MDNGLYKIVSEVPETVDTPDQIAYQLANLNYRLDILLTIALFALTISLIVGICYLFYRYILKFIP